MAGGFDITEEVSASTLAYPVGSVDGAPPEQLQNGSATNGVKSEANHLENGTGINLGGDTRNGEGLPGGDVGADPAAKKRGFANLLSRTASGKSNGHLEPSPNGTPTTDAAALEETSPKYKGWFGGVLGRRSRPSSTDGDASSPVVVIEAPAAAAAAPQRHSIGPIVGNIPVIAGSLPGDASSSGAGSGSSTPADGNSPRKKEPASAPASTLTTPEMLSVDVGVEGDGKGGYTSANPVHRRHRSWLGPFGWSKPPRQKSIGTSSGDLDVLHAINGVFSPEATLGVGNGAVVDISMLETQPEPVLPAGTRGIVNVGNSCYVGAAFQCLRFTPTLPLRLIPDLLEQAAAAQVPATTSVAASSAAEQQTQSIQAGGVGPLAAGAAAAAATTAAVAPEASEDTAEPMDAADAVPDATGQLKAAATAAAAAHAHANSDEDGEQPTDMVIESHALTESDQAEPSGDPEVAEAAAPVAAPVVVAAPPAPLPRPGRGELSTAVSSLVTDLYLGPVVGRGADPTPLMQILRRFPAAADYFDGGQHDCQEVLQALVDLLHEDLNTATPPPPLQPEKKKETEMGEEEELEKEAGEETAKKEDELPKGAKDEGENQPVASPAGPTASLLPPKSPTTTNSESTKADAAWSAVQSRNCSPISDLFMGQLQSCVVCSKCGGRFTTYEPFWELSLPLVPKSGGSLTSWLGLKPGGALTLQDCLQAYTSEEKLEGEEAFDCEVCKEKTSATKRLRLHRLPDALVLHIKRFRHRGTTADKLTTNVTFPLKALDLAIHGSPECPHPPEHCCYDLYAVSNHSGNVGGGHYTACCRAPQAGDGGEGWWSFNDEIVTSANAASVVSQNAYILFYFRRKFKDPAAAAAAYAARPQHGHPSHRRSRSGGSSGSGGLFAGTFLRGGESKG